MKTVAIASAVVALTAAVAAQETSNLPSFETASIKLRDPGTPPGRWVQSPDRFTNPDGTAAQLIAYAWDIPENRITGGPGWLKSRRFEVSAKAERAEPDTRKRLMMRRLLGERFGLKVRLEPREMAVYRLVRARSDGRLDDRLRESKDDCQAIIEAGQVRSPSATGEPPRCAWRVAIMSNAATMLVDGVRMQRFAGMLEALAGRPVIDRTGLAGTYDLTLDFSPDLPGVPRPPGGADAPPSSSREAPALATALREQLGLELESGRGAMTILIVEAAEEPTAN